MHSSSGRGDPAPRERHSQNFQSILGGSADYHYAVARTASTPQPHWAVGTECTHHLRCPGGVRPQPPVLAPGPPGSHLRRLWCLVVGHSCLSHAHKARKSSPAIQCPTGMERQLLGVVPTRCLLGVLCVPATVLVEGMRPLPSWDGTQREG